MDTELAAMPVIDIDTHFTEPRDMWTSRAPQKLRDRAPHVVQGPEGNEQWVVEDLVLGPPGFCVIGKDGQKSYGVISLPRFEDMSVASTNPEARLRYMDEFGLHTQILYPNTLGFAGNNMMKISDVELRNFCITGYNDAMAEVQRAGKGRLYPQALLPFWDIELTVKELKRCHEQLGMTGFTMTDSPESWGLPFLNDPHWDPLWAESQERGLPVNFHIGSGVIPGMWAGLEQNNRGIAAVSTMLFMNNMRCLTQLIFSGLLDRFPRLKFVSVESGIGWVPFILETTDYEMAENAPAQLAELKRLPSEYFRDHWYVTYWFERNRGNVQGLIDSVGEDNVLFETDFPHPTCLFPRPLEVIAGQTSAMRPQTRRKLLGENAAKLYRL
jgi:predicted TIM-barrel fold metal-dependent hydrolase